ncbi:phosphopyruvate hydratase [Candidatus Pacearchaeota archaeon]|nr:phosphopyruvate hydratase [Candidatus Pacearchaeota archaeon]
MSKILSIKANEILDSRKKPTVSVVLTTEKGSFHAAVPSGASTGIYEAMELRDSDSHVSRAIKNVNEIIAERLIGLNPEKQKEIDNLMIKFDGTKNKSRLGANAILGVSMAVCRAGAVSKNIPLYKHIAELSENKKLILPFPFFNIINGGRHAKNNLAIQEFMIVPISKNFKEALEIGAEIYNDLKKIIIQKYPSFNIGDEGGFSPNLNNTEEALDLLRRLILKSKHNKKVRIAIDAAASEFFKDNYYDLDIKNPNNIGKMRKTGEELIEFYKNLIKKYNILSIEDPFSQDDWKSYGEFTKEIGKKLQIVGDDLLVTNPSRIKQAISQKACNALLLKINQIGTITESINAYKLAKKAKWKVMVSHRSGETRDDFIADLVVGLGTGQIKSGAPFPIERMTKYNRLVEIEKELHR